MIENCIEGNIVPGKRWITDHWRESIGYAKKLIQNVKEIDCNEFEKAYVEEYRKRENWSNE